MKPLRENWPSMMTLSASAKIRMEGEVSVNRGRMLSICHPFTGQSPQHIWHCREKEENSRSQDHQYSRKSLYMGVTEERITLGVK